MTYQLHKFTMGENTGTHVDAPSHFIKSKNSIYKIPLNKLVLQIIVINIKKQVKSNNHYQLTIADIKKWEQKGKSKDFSAHQIFLKANKLYE